MRIILALILLAMSVAPSLAQRQRELPIIVFHAPQKSGELNSQKLYLLSYQCVENVKSMSGSSVRDFIAKFTPAGSTLTTNGFYIKPAAATITAPNTTESVANAVAAELVYTLDATQGKDHRNTCNRHFIVRGGAYELTVFSSSAKSAATAQIATFATVMSSILPTAFTLVSGKQMPTEGTEFLARSSSFLNAYDDFVKIFDRTATHTKQYDLSTGTYFYSTPVFDVTITVAELQSALTHPLAPFRQIVGDLVGQSPPTLKTTDLTDLSSLHGKCTPMINRWESVGVQNDADKAYAVWSQIDELPGLSKEAIIKCLGQDLAKAAVPALHLFNIDDTQSFSFGDVEIFAEDNQVSHPIWELQPDGWPGLASFVGQFINTSNRRATGVELRELQLARYLEQFEDELTITDQTSDYAIVGLLMPGDEEAEQISGSPTDIMDRLSEIGIKEWGCWGATNNPARNYKSDNNESVIMLARLIGNDGSEKVFGVRTLFVGRDLRELVFTDDFDPQQFSDAVCPSSTFLKRPAA